MLTKVAETGCSLGGYLTRHKISRIEKITSAITFILLALFTVATIGLLWRNVHFWFDDLVHFRDAQAKTLLSMMATRIDVHLAPLHQLASFIIFKFYGLNFGLALGAIAAFWIACVVSMHRLLRRLSSNQMASIVTLLFGSSPLWFHTLVWWSAAAHRLPYLLLQISALLMYLRYREWGKSGDAFYCALSQIFALGFFMKAILFPAVLVAFEFCLAAQYKSLSLAGLKLCFAMGIISTSYVGWYFLFMPYSHDAFGLGLVQSLPYAMHYTSGLGSLLLFLPIDQPWSGWVSGAFWITLVCCRIYYRPASALPITALLVLVIINFTMSIWGRGLFVASPLSSLRYYAEVIVIVAVFATLALISNQPAGATDENTASTILASALSLILVITYPVTSYFSNQHLFQTIYMERKQARKFMINVQRTLEELNTQASPKILQANFPAFVYGWLAIRLPVEDVFGKLYPHIEWIPPAQAKNGLNVIQDDGSVASLVLPGSAP